MAWTAPITWGVGQLVAATNLNAQLRDNSLILKAALDDSGKIVAIDSTRFASLDGTNLTGVLTLAGNVDFTTGVQNFNAGSGTRIVFPVGSGKWAT